MPETRLRPQTIQPGVCAPGRSRVELLSMDSITVRAAVPDDFDEILDLWNSFDRHVGLEDRREHLLALHAFSPELFLVAEKGGKIAGTLIAGWDGWRAQMARLATRSDARRSGVARLLVGEGELRLRERGANRIYALVDRRSAPAGPFWSALGYAPNEDVIQYSRNLVQEAADAGRHDSRSA